MSLSFEKKSADGVSRRAPRDAVVPRSSKKQKTNPKIIEPQEEEEYLDDDRILSSPPVREPAVSMRYRATLPGARPLSRRRDTQNISDDGLGHGTERLKWVKELGKVANVFRRKSPSSSFVSDDSGKDIIPKSRSKAWWGVVSGFLILAALLIVLSTVFARLTVVTKLKVEILALDGMTATFDIASSQVNTTDRLIPAERLEFSKKVVIEFPATGQSFVGERSRGKVKIYNNFNTSPQPLVAQTRFLTESGVLFRLPHGVVVPGAKLEKGKLVPQSIEVEIVADQPGEEANMAGELTLKLPGLKGTPKYKGFYALALTGFAGGFRGEAKVATRDDIVRATDEASKKAMDGVKIEAVKKMPQGFILKEDFTEIKIKKVDAPQAGTKADHFSVEAEAVARVLIFRTQDSLLFLKELVLKDDTKSELIQDASNLEYHIKNLNFDKGKAEVVIKGNIKTKRVLKKDELAGELAGKKEGSLAEVLRGRDELAAFTLSFFPPWLSRAPRDPAKIMFVTE